MIYNAAVFSLYLLNILLLPIIAVIVTIFFSAVLCRVFTAVLTE